VVTRGVWANTCVLGRLNAHIALELPACVLADQAHI